MTTRSAKVLALSTCLCYGAAMVAAAAAQTAYTFTTFTVPNSTETAPFGINDSGELTGFYGASPSGGQIGFLRLVSGQVTTVLYPGASGSLANGINDSGVVAGTYWDANQSALAGFLYRAGMYENVVVNRQPAAVDDVNDNGYYVGTYGTSQSFTAFMASPDGNVTILKYPGGYRTAAAWIKNSGEIIGTYEDRFQGLHTFLYNAKSGYKTIQIPGLPGATIGDINSSGVIVGSYFDGVTDQAFVYQGGSFRYLQVPGANDSTAGAINNKGQIVGAYTTPGSQYIGYIATPVQ
jgi:uncharacterized membrane protein